MRPETGNPPRAVGMPVCGIVIVSLCLAAWVAAACGSDSGPPEGPTPEIVSVAQAQVKAVEERIPIMGRTEAARRVRLVALVEGVVEEIAVADGSTVEMGQPIMTLGGSRTVQRLRAREDRLRAARQRRHAAKERLERARRRRENGLARPGEAESAEEALAEARSALATALAEERRYRDALRIVAPWAGVFLDRRVSPGQRVRPGEELGEILDPQSLRIVTTFLPRAGADVRVGMAAEILRSEHRALGARVAQVAAVSPGTGPVTLWLEGPSLAQLSPGEAVRGSIVLDRRDEAVVVPTSAVVRGPDGQAYVFVGEKRPFRRRPVTPGVRGRDWTEIREGVAPDELVVVTGAYELFWAPATASNPPED